MIPIVRFWETLMQSLKTGTSGYQSKDEFNRDMNAVETAAMSTLSPYYAKNLAVQEILAPFVVTAANATTKPSGWFQMVSAGVNGHEAYPIAPNQKELILTSPTRKPTEKVSYYILLNDGIEWLTHDNDNTGTMVYLRSPIPGEIELTESSTADSDYLTPTSVTDLEWPERAFNILLYMMMDRLGLEMREQLALEFSQIGIQSELIKIQ